MSKNFEIMQQMERERFVHDDRAYSSNRGVSTEAYQLKENLGWASDEALRLVQRVFLLQTQPPPQVVVFSGVDRSSGCSGIATAVALALSQNAVGQVCLVDANFRSPSLASFFQAPNRPGLIDAVLSDEPIRSFAVPVVNENLWLVPTGTAAEDSANLLVTDRLRSRLAGLRSSFEFIIVDTPSLTSYADAIAIAKASDGVVLVLEAEATRRVAAQTVAASLRAANVNIVAAVLNKRMFPIPEPVYKRI